MIDSAAGQNLITTQLAVGGAMLAATTFVHALFVVVAAVAFRAVARRVWGPLRFVRDLVILVVWSSWLLLAHLVGVAMWGWLFLRLSLFETLEGALYFSIVSYTTLGFGDVLLAEEWRLLSGFAAANGLLLFGLSAAFLFDMTARLRLAGFDIR